MTVSDSRTGEPVWQPKLWLRSLAATPQAHWSHTRAIRAAIGVGGPLLIAALLGHAALGMWISMGSLFFNAGERSGAFSARFRQVAVVTPFAVGAFFLGYLSHAPAWLTTVLMALLALAFGIASGYSHLLSVATMQALLIASLSIGVPGVAPYWPAALLFLAGVAVYSLLLGIEAILFRHHPQRDALNGLLLALAQLAEEHARGTADLAPYRARAVAALNAFDENALVSQRRTQGPTHSFIHAARTSRAADQLIARFLAYDSSPVRSEKSAERLRELAAAVRHHAPAPPAGADPTLVRTQMLEDAIWGRSAASATPAAAASGDPHANEHAPKRRLLQQFRITPPGRDLILTAIRLALSFGIAFAVFEFTGFERGYWIPLTAALVMKPDLGSVFARAVLRSGGTVLGAIIAMLVGLLLPGDIWLAIVAIVFAAALPWAASRSYGFQALIMTPLIMLMINLVDTKMTILELSELRILATCLGAAIVLVFGYALWPSARHPNIGARFKTVLENLAAFAQSLGGDAETVAARQRTAYRSLSDLRVAVQRTLAEPPPAGFEAAAWLPVVSTAERVADRITEIAGSFSAPDASPDAMILSTLADHIEELTRFPVLEDRDSRGTEALAAADAAEDPSLRELADDIAHLRTLLTHRTRHESRTEHEPAG